MSCDLAGTIGVADELLKELELFVKETLEEWQVWLMGVLR